MDKRAFPAVRTEKTDTLYKHIFCSCHATLLGVLQTSISSAGPLHLLLPPPGMIFPQKCKAGFLNSLSLCSNVTFSAKTYLHCLSPFPVLFSHSTYYYLTCYIFYFLVALCILLPKEQKLSVHLQILKHCLHMVDRK